MTLDEEIQADAATVAAQANGSWEGETMTTTTQEATRTFQVDSLAISVKTGTTKKGAAWTRYGALLEGEDDTAVWGGTFDAGTGGQLQTLKGKAATITAERDGDFWNIISVEPATGNPTTTTPSTATVNQELKGYQMTLSQQLAAIYSSDATMTAIITATDEDRAKLMAKIDSIVKHNAIVVFTTPMPSDEDVPF